MLPNSMGITFLTSATRSGVLLEINYSKMLEISKKKTYNFNKIPEKYPGWNSFLMNWYTFSVQLF